MIVLKKVKKTIVLALVSVLALISAGLGYAVPQDVDAYCNPSDSKARYDLSTNVEIWANGTDFQGGQIELTYDPSCANVTLWQKGSDFSFGKWNSLTNGNEFMTFTSTTWMTGEYLLGTLTVQCVSDSIHGCTSPLHFTGKSKLYNQYGDELPTLWNDGAFECPSFTCGDVNCNDIVDMGDIILLLNKVNYGYQICRDWTGNTKCNADIDMGDVIILLNNVTYGQTFPLECCQAP